MGALALGGLRVIAMGLGATAVVDHVKNWFFPAATSADPSTAGTIPAPGVGGSLLASPLLLVALAGGAWYFFRGSRSGARR